MDELPHEARRMLTLAKSAQPTAQPGTREQVRVRVDAALAGAVVTMHADNPPAVAGGKTLLTNSKILLASTVLVIGGSSVLWGRRTPDVTHVPRAAPAAVVAPAQAELPAQAPARAHVVPVEEPQVELPATGAPTPKHIEARRGPEQHFMLAAEISLLSEAQEALADHDVSRARALLLDHKKRFHNAQLREEREGLWSLARCLEEPTGGRQEAVAFLGKNPGSLLAPRIKRACGLADDR